MKKCINLFLIILFNCFFLKAQNPEFGVVAGYNHQYSTLKGSMTMVIGMPDTSSTDINETNNASGAYVGMFLELNVFEKINLYSELQFAFTSSNEVSESELIFPVFAKYYITEKISLAAGPQLDFILSSDTEGVKTIGIGIGIGGGYKISDRLTFNLRYSHGLNNRLDNGAYTLPGADYDVTGKYSFMQIGLAYQLKL